MAKLRTTIIGAKFNLLTVIEDLGMHICGTKGQRHRKVKCLCDCGREAICFFNSIRQGKWKSCGCLKKNNKYSDVINKGADYKKILSLWNNIKTRCYNDKYPRFKNYGGRGIKICDKWKDSFPIFYNWAITNGYKIGLQIDRIDNNGDYCPENCRFVTKEQNQRNKRSSRYIEINGVKKVLCEWAEEIGFTDDCLRYRIISNWPQDKLLRPSQR